MDTKEVTLIYDTITTPKEQGLCELPNKMPINPTPGDIEQNIFQRFEYLRCRAQSAQRVLMDLSDLLTATPTIDVIFAKSMRDTIKILVLAQDHIQYIGRQQIRQYIATLSHPDDKKDIKH